MGQTLRRLGGRQPLCGIGVTSLMPTTSMPVFWIVRMAEIFVYPPLTWLIGLPKYKNADWVNVSRQKFNGRS